MAQVADFRRNIPVLAQKRTDLYTFSVHTK